MPDHDPRSARQAGRATVALVTDMNQPLGRAVGNALEMIEAIETLKGKGPADVLEVSLALSAQMVLVAGKEKRFKQALALVGEKLTDGRALEVFRRFIAAGGRSGGVRRFHAVSAEPLETDLICDKNGYISRIDAFEVGMAAVDIGAGRRIKEESVDPAAGFISIETWEIACKPGKSWSPCTATTRKNWKKPAVGYGPP